MSPNFKTLGSGIRIEKDGALIVANARKLNFTGAGVSSVAEGIGAKADIPGGGGGGIDIKDEGVLVKAGATFIDFRGGDIEAVIDGTGVKTYSPPIPPPSFGYYGGGDNTVTCDKLDFSNDAIAMVGVGSLNSASEHGTGFNSSLMGYFTKGLRFGLGSNISRLDFANDTVLQTAAALDTDVWKHEGGNSTLKGYICGGNKPADNLVTLSKSLLFSNDTAALVNCGLMATARYSVACANSSLKSYFAGGQTDSITFSTACDALLFSNDSVAMLAVASLLAARSGMAGYNSSTKGYFSSGNDLVARTQTYAIDFANDALAMTSKGALPVGKSITRATNSISKGYVAGGGVNTHYALLFANDSAIMTTVASLPASKNEMGTCQSGGLL